MKKIKFNISLLFLLFLIIAGCSADFIEEKKDYSSVNVGIYQYESLANGYLEFLYGAMSPDGNANMAAWSKAAEDNAVVAGTGDDGLFAKSTDQLASRTVLNREWADISPSNDHCIKSIGLRLGTGYQNTAYTRIRYCNLYLENVDEYTGLEEDFKNQIKAQFYFWRAWQYFELVRLYGGVPLVLTAQPANVDDPEVQTPRSKSSEVFEQIVQDLDMADELFKNARPYTAEETGKITRAAAAALKGRALLTWASPQFNRNDDQGRWQRAYDANLAAYNVALAAGKGLDPDWRNMFFKDNGMESVFAFGFNDFATNTDGFAKNNYTEYQSRSQDQGGNKGILPTKNVMDAFPMEDGTPYNPDGDLNHFYRDRDPRFYHTFVYNGAIWPYAEDPDYRTWIYYWFPLNADPSGPKRPAIEQNDTGVYLKKFTNAMSSNNNAFRNNGNDYMDIRFAEIVLNLAESAIGINNLSEGKGFIQDIRARAGVINNDGQYGLSSYTSRDQLFEAVINERKVEFAYENKRFHDLRRWLLYNDDFGTCTRLNQEPIDGSRRKGYYIYAKIDPATYYVGIPDPFVGAGSGAAPIIDREATTYPEGISTYDEYLDYLYDNHFEVVVRDNVEESNFEEFTWYNEYYFFGIHQQAMDTAPYLNQTQGWGGSFNPLE